MHDLGHAEGREHRPGRRPWRAPAVDRTLVGLGSTGSAPFKRDPQRRQVEPLSARRSARVASTQAKLGPAVPVPPYSTASGPTGRAGHEVLRAGEHQVDAVAMAEVRIPTRPMSWYSGSHDTTTSSSGSSRAGARAMASRLARPRGAGASRPWAPRSSRS